MDDVDLVIVGAGQSGLAAARAARGVGATAVVLEAGDEPVGSWPNYYDSLHLFSPARYSSLPGLPFPGDPDHYPARDEVIDYLRTYAKGLDADVRLNHRVVAVHRRDASTFHVTTADGTVIAARAVIAATCAFGSPYTPALPGLDEFAGTVMHAADYRRPDQLAGTRVIVVGGGNSAVQIAIDLAATARVTIATRRPLRWANQHIRGRDLHWWLRHTGLDIAPIARQLRDRPAMMLDNGHYRATMATGNPDHQPLFTRLDDRHVHWTDGTTERIDAIILATGYRPNVDHLASLGALTTDGAPAHRAGLSTAVPGLGYLGIEYQRTFSSNTLRGVARDARHVIHGLRPHWKQP